MKAERSDMVVIGGQAELAMGYYLKVQERDFAILDAGDRNGDAWRRRWDSLRLFTPAALSGLPGMPFPLPGDYFPTKDETADYLEEYARRFDLPVRLASHVPPNRPAKRRQLLGIVVALVLGGFTAVSLLALRPLDPQPAKAPAN